MKICRECRTPLEVGFNWRQANKDNYDYKCIDCYNKTARELRLKTGNAYMKEYRSREENKARRRDKSLQKAYGITLEDYNNRWTKNKGCCEICGDHETVLNRALHVDHNHDTGSVRGLLCSNCNTGIGMLKEDISILQKAVDYLEGEEWDEERMDIIGQNGNSGEHYVTNDDGTTREVQHIMKESK